MLIKGSENNADITNLGTWYHDFAEGRIFRAWFIKPMFTPYEIDLKARDESYLEDTKCTFIIINSFIELPDGDALVEYKVVYDLQDKEDREKENYSYRKLSEMQLSYYEDDQSLFDDDYEDDEEESEEEN